MLEIDKLLGESCKLINVITAHFSIQYIYIYNVTFATKVYIVIVKVNDFSHTLMHIGCVVLAPKTKWYLLGDVVITRWPSFLHLTFSRTHFKQGLPGSHDNFFFLILVSSGI